MDRTPTKTRTKPVFPLAPSKRRRTRLNIRPPPITLPPRQIIIRTTPGDMKIMTSNGFVWASRYILSIFNDIFLNSLNKAAAYQDRLILGTADVGVSGSSDEMGEFTSAEVIEWLGLFHAPAVPPRSLAYPAAVLGICKKCGSADIVVDRAMAIINSMDTFTVDDVIAIASDKWAAAAHRHMFDIITGAPDVEPFAAIPSTFFITMVAKGASPLSETPFR